LYAEFDDLAATSWRYLSQLAEPAHVLRQEFCIDFPYVDQGSPDAGPRPVCSVSELATSPDGLGRESTVEACPEAGTTDDTEMPCWRPVPDNNKCPVLGLRIDIRQPPASCRTPDRLEYWATCVVEYTEATTLESWNAPLPCGSEDAPVTLPVMDRVPALGATVKNRNLTEGFTIDWPGFEITPPSLIRPTPRHTAGYETEQTTGWIASNSGKNERYERSGAVWSAAPGHVELSAAVGWRTEAGCHFKLPSPLLSYDVTP
jgi:hypothetical protein